MVRYLTSIVSSDWHYYLQAFLAMREGDGLDWFDRLESRMLQMPSAIPSALYARAATIMFGLRP